MDELPTEISILTLNCWGLKFLSKLHRERLTEIGRQIAIAEPRPHIVALQECWTQEDYQSIRRETRFVLPYGKFYFSGAFGGGLAILSRWPIEESSMYPYRLNGRPTAFWRGDWYVGKGVAWAKIRYGPGAKQVAEVFNTHTHAPYESGPNDSYLCHRNAQAWEIAKLMRGAAERGHLVIACGDFNMIPSSLAYALITGHAPVRDCWRVLHPDSSVGPADDPAEKARRRPIPTAEYNLLENGIASDGPYCTWRWNKNMQNRLLAGKDVPDVDPNQPDPRGKRLDYVFAGSGDVAALGGGWVVRRVAVGMTMRHPELRCSLSDHFAVEATLVFQPLKTSPDDTGPANHSTAPAALIGSGDGPRDSAVRVSSELIIDKDTSTAAAESLVAKSDSTQGAPQSKRHSTKEEALQNGAYLQSPTSSSFRGSKGHAYNSQLAALSVPEPPPLPLASYDEILTEIKRYRARERAQRVWRGRHFFAWLVVWIGCLVGVWWVAPRAGYGAFLMLLVAPLGLVAGTVDGLLALLFFKWELRALREFEWEIMNAKAAAGGGLALVRELQEVGSGDEGVW